jgi:hypothetical protein
MTDTEQSQRGQHPDPSSLTTAQLLRENFWLRELLETRLNAIDRAISLAHEDLVRVPTEVDKAIGHLQQMMLGEFKVVEEKFASVQKQFVERDTRATTQRESDKTAVDAALQAQKEAAGKSQESFTKQIDQSDKRVDDLRERVGMIEGVHRGGSDATTTRQAAGASLQGSIGMWVGVLGLLLGAIVAFLARTA